MPLGNEDIGNLTRLPWFLDSVILVSKESVPCRMLIHRTLKPRLGGALNWELKVMYFIVKKIVVKSSSTVTELKICMNISFCVVNNMFKNIYTYIKQIFMFSKFYFFIMSTPIEILLFVKCHNSVCSDLSNLTLNDKVFLKGLCYLFWGRNNVFIILCRIVILGRIMTLFYLETNHGACNFFGLLHLMGLTCG